MDESIKFIADGMLGRLARWLRLIGYDTEYFSGKDKYFLAYKARNEKRIVLTRDRKFVLQHKSISILIESENLLSQLKEVKRKLNLSFNRDRFFSLCSICNQPLEPKNLSDVVNQVPPYVAKTQKNFSQCKKCGRIYWQATHWEKMLNFIKELDHEK
ncbi:MAG: Mut7-C RNAse domain-containing protein [Candidatus Omnitrophica bacterium]|nr:Mut7-C RNAse domain-containing protein [Candidatus Omnitrophota bacterium]